MRSTALRKKKSWVYDEFRPVFPYKGVQSVANEKEWLIWHVAYETQFSPWWTLIIRNTTLVGHKVSNFVLCNHLLFPILSMKTNSKYCNINSAPVIRRQRQGRWFFFLLLLFFIVTFKWDKRNEIKGLGNHGVYAVYCVITNRIRASEIVETTFSFCLSLALNLNI